VKAARGAVFDEEKPHESHDHDPDPPQDRRAAVPDLPLRPRMPVFALRVRNVLRLRTQGSEPKLEAMDPQALVPLLVDERERLVRLALRRMPTEADAEDVVQRALMRATERAGSLEDPARLRPWLARILLRGIADFYRSRRPEGSSDTEGIEDPADAPGVSGNTCACSVRLLADLPPSYADVLRRVDMDGQAPEAAAAALAISVTNLHVRLHRARRALRERVKEHCGVSTCGPCLDCTCHARGRCGDSVAVEP
jgi:RNA polymerase sigma factor (sigma-70 family)